MAQIINQTRSGTNEIPLDGGLIKAEGYGSIVDDSYDALIDVLADVGFWTFNSSSGSVSALGNGRFQTETSGSVDSVSWYSPDIDMSAAKYEFSVTVNFLENQIGTSYNVSIRDPDLSTSDNRVVFYFENNNAGEIDIFYDHVDNSKNITFTKLKTVSIDEQLDIRIHYSNSRFSVGFRTGPSEGFEFLYSDIADFPSIAHVIMSEFESSEISVWEWNSHKFLPTLEYFPSDTYSDHPVCMSKSGNDAYFNIFPGFPGKFDSLQLHGVGDNFGSAESVKDLVSIPSEQKEGDISFLYTPIEDFDTDLTFATRCRDKAVRVGEISGDLEVNLKCFDDGTSTLNSGSPNDHDRVEVNDTSKFVAGNNAGIADEDYPEFIFKEIKGQKESERTKYGENFSFQQLHTGVDSLMDVGQTDVAIKRLRTLVLSNRDVVYYGIGHQPYNSAQDVTLEIDPVGSDADWELGRADLTEGHSNKVIDSGTFVSSTTTINKGLEPGFYYLRLNRSNGGVYWGSSNTTNSDRINYIEDIQSAYSNGVGPNNETYADGETQHKLFFEIKKPRGFLVGYYHDRSSNDFYTFKNTTEDVCLRSDSVAACEMDNGNVAVFYELAQSKGFKANKRNKLTFRELDINSQSGFSGTRHVVLPVTDRGNDNAKSDKFIHSFDVVRTKDNIEFFVSLRDFSESALLSPKLVDFVETWTCRIGSDPNDRASFQLSVADGSIEYIEAVEDDGVLPLSSLIRLYEHGKEFDAIAQEQFLNNKTVDIQAGGVHYLDCNYDRDRDLIVASVLNYRQRAPLIYAGRNSDFSEVAVPRFFDMYSRGERAISQSNEEIFSDPNHLHYLDIRSISSVFGVDGQIYSVATKGEYYPIKATELPYEERDCELAIVDTSLYYSSQDAHVNFRTKDIGDELGLFATFSDTEYRFETIPFRSHYKDADSYTGPWMASLASYANYMICCFGDRNRGRNKVFPRIYQSGHQDEVPFEVPLDEAWIRESGTDTQYNFNNVDFSVTSRSGETDNSSFYSNLSSGTTLPFATIYNGYDNGASIVRSDVSRSLGSDTFRRAQASNGYRFSILFNERKSSNLFQAEFAFEATFVEKVRPGVFDRARVAMFYNGSEVQARKYDYSGGSWKNIDAIGTFDDHLKEFDIIVKYLNSSQNQEGEFKLVFIVKENPHLSNVEQDIHYSSFRVSASAGEGTGDFDRSTSTTTTSYSCYFDNASTDYSELVELHRMGWCPLEVQDGLLSESLSDGTFDDNAIITSGKEWRNLDDSEVLRRGDTDNYPYPYRMSLLDSDDTRSAKFHWPNGFELFFSGTDAQSGDSWILNRKSLKNLDNLKPSRIHSYYTTSRDDSAVKIWSDSKDFGVDKFKVDTLIVTGMNFPKINVIATNQTDSNGNPTSWNYLDTISSKMYSVNNSNILTPVNEASDKAVVDLDGAQFLNGSFEFLKQYWVSFDRLKLVENQPISLNHDDAALVKRSRGGSLLLEQIDTNTGFDHNKNGAIFSSKVFERYDKLYEYRFFGIEIPAFPTKEDGFQLNSVIFGHRDDLPVRYFHNESTNFDYSMNIESSYAFDEQAYYSDKSGMKKRFNVSIENVDGENFDKVKTMLEEISITRKPIWIIEDGSSHHRVYQCFMDGDFSYDPVIYENGDRIYNFDFELVSVQ